MNASPTQATVQETAGVLTVVFDRDAKLNAISPSMTDLLWSSVRRLADDDAIRVLVITAVGRYFTAGIDLGAPQPGTVARTGQEFRRLYRRHHLLYDEMEAVEKPIILAAQGPCLGAGLEMACSCDFRFASPLTRFQLPEVKLGVIAGSGGTSRLTRLIGPHWAKWLAMANRSIDAERALAIGLVHDVFAADTFAADVAAFAAELAALPGEALGAAKLVVDMAVDADRETGRQIDRFANTHLCLAGEFRGSTNDFNRR